MKFTTENYLKLKSLINRAIPSTKEEIQTLEYTARGLYKNIDNPTSPFQIWNYSLQNLELKEFLSNLFNQDPTKITTMHRLRYNRGGSSVPHKDKATYTFVLILDADLQEGGEFYLNGEYRDDFKETGDYLSYNGGTEIHEVKELKKGHRDVFVAWWYDDIKAKTTI